LTKRADVVRIEVTVLRPMKLLEGAVNADKLMDLSHCTEHSVALHRTCHLLILTIGPYSRRTDHPEVTCQYLSILESQTTTRFSPKSFTVDCKAI